VRELCEPKATIDAVVQESLPGGNQLIIGGSHPRKAKARFFGFRRLSCPGLTPPRCEKADQLSFHSLRRQRSCHEGLVSRKSVAQAWIAAAFRDLI
jgi:hypothetical protein